MKSNRWLTGFAVTLSLGLTFSAFGQTAAREALPSPLASVSVPAGGFRFTVTSDVHLKTNAYARVLEAMQSRAGQSAFQVCVGDIVDAAGQSPDAVRGTVDRVIGPGSLWFPLVGNHDSKSAVAMDWFRTEYETGHGTRPPIGKLISRPGPAGCLSTTYSWDYGNAHFVALNEYWDGSDSQGHDAKTSGDIVPALCAWLESDLATNSKPFVFIFGHEPAFAETRHVGNSLDANPAHRDAFWAVLKKYRVQAFFSGHIHYYYKLRQDGVYQISDGHARGGKENEYQTFLDVAVGADEAKINVWHNDVLKPNTWWLAETIPLPAVPKRL